MDGPHEYLIFRARVGLARVSTARAFGLVAGREWPPAWPPHAGRTLVQLKIPSLGLAGGTAWTGSQNGSHCLESVGGERRRRV